MKKSTACLISAFGVVAIFWLKNKIKEREKEFQDYAWSCDNISDSSIGEIGNDGWPIDADIPSEDD